MRIAQLRQYDIANGEGIRVTLFVSGCHFHCEGCFNPQYQDFNFGDILTEQRSDEIIRLVNDPNISGFSLLGGEPLDQDLNELELLLSRIKFETGKTIWVWTGYTIEHLSHHQRELVNKYVDVLVDGQFVEELKDMRLLFRGSSNQRVLDIKEINQHKN